MQTSSSQRSDHAILSAGEHHCSQNWNLNTPKQHFSTVGLDIEKLTPSLPGQDSSVSSPSTSHSPPFMAGRTSNSMLSEKNLSEQQQTPMTSTTVSPQSIREDSLQVSECEARSSHSVGIERSQSSPNFAQSTASSRQRSQKNIHRTQKAEEFLSWTPLCTRPKSPNLQCVGKASEFASVKGKDTHANSTCSKSSNHNKAISCNRKLPTPSEPKTPKVLRRPSMYKRRVSLKEEPSRTFIPNPTPRYLKTGNLPQIKPTRKSQQRAETCRNPERSLRQEVPKKPTTSAPLEPTSVTPFELGSVMKHEEHVYQIQQRIVVDEDDDKKRREFHPVTLRPEILEGPTFVPRRSEVPLTKPIDLLPHAKERSERTLAFEARQHARMEEAARNERIAAEEREKRKDEILKKDYESKRFKSKPVPQSHYKPDIDPVRVEDKTHSHSPTSETLQRRNEIQFLLHAVNKTESEETELTYKEVTEPTNVLTNHTPTENKAVSILQGLRKSLSPLLGRGSTSLS